MTSFPITAHPDAPQGRVETLDRYDVTLFKPPCIILCRMTAPLVSFAYDLLRRHVPCTVKGKDIGAGLVALIKRLKAEDMFDLGTKLNAWWESELKRAEDSHKSPERIEDQYACISIFMRGLDTTTSVSVLIKRIEDMFSENSSPSRVLLSTIHRAKGLEYPTVFILDREKTLPSRYAVTREAKTQERNLWFVAVTRAQENLYYITSNRWTNSSL